MTDQEVGLEVDQTMALAPAASGGSAMPVWGMLREIGGLGLLRLLPGVLRSVFTRRGLESPGGVALRRPDDRDADHLPDVSLDSAVTAEDLAATASTPTAAETVDVAEAEDSAGADLVEQRAEVLDLDPDAEAAAQAAQVAQAAEVAEASTDVDEAGLS